jgi:hypothetical protein
MLAAWCLPDRSRISIWQWKPVRLAAERWARRASSRTRAALVPEAGDRRRSVTGFLCGEEKKRPGQLVAYSGPFSGVSGGTYGRSLTSERSGHVRLEPDRFWRTTQDVVVGNEDVAEPSAVVAASSAKTSDALGRKGDNCPAASWFIRAEQAAQADLREIYALPYDAANPNNTPIAIDTTTIASRKQGTHPRR